MKWEQVKHRDVLIYGLCRVPRGVTIEDVEEVSGYRDRRTFQAKEGREMERADLRPGEQLFRCAVKVAMTS